MAAFMYRLSGSPRGADPTCTGPAFPDVPASHPFCGEIDWLVDEGITTGFSDDTYRPTQGVTRQSMAAFMYRLAGSAGGPDPMCTVEAFTDVPVSHPFCGEIAAVADAEIVAGFPDGSYRPGNPVTREAMAAFMYRLADGHIA
jgi:endo-1,4-beta-xylanase